MVLARNRARAQRLGTCEATGLGGAIGASDQPLGVKAIGHGM